MPLTPPQAALLIQSAWTSRIHRKQFRRTKRCVVVLFYAVKLWLARRLLRHARSRAQINEKIDKRVRQRMQTLDALERTKLALTSNSSRPVIGVVEYKYQYAVTIQIHFRLHRRRARLARLRALHLQGHAPAAARTICKFWRAIISRRKPPPLPPLMRLRANNRQMPRMPQTMSMQRAAELQSRIAAVKEKPTPPNVAKQRLPQVLATLNAKMQEYNEQQEDSSAESCSRSLLRQQVLHAYTDLHRQKTLASLPQTTGMLRSGDAGAARALHAALRGMCEQAQWWKTIGT